MALPKVKIYGTMGYTPQPDSILFVNEGDPEEFRVQGYRRDTCGTCLFYISGILSVGLTFLLGYWYPVKRFIYTHRPCNLSNATSVLVKQFDIAQRFVCDIRNIQWSEGERKNIRNSGFAEFEKLHSSANFRYFEHMFLRYYISENCDQVIELSGLNDLSVRQIYDLSAGSLSPSKTKIYGENFINIPVKSVPIIFLQLLANPFYVFQLTAFIFWFAANYVIFPAVIMCLTLSSLVISTWNTRKHLQKLHDMVGNETMVTVLEKRLAGSVEVFKSSRDLVPGDLIVIPPTGMDVPCDMVLLHGRCTVNESALTGESFPATKTSLDGITSSNKDLMTETYAVTVHKNHTMYNGTTIIEATAVGGDRVMALVVTTGFSTIKGRLIRSIIYPKPVNFTFFRDSMRFVFCLFILGAAGAIYSIVTLHWRNADALNIAFRSLGMLTVIVSPALPTCMSLSLMFAVKQLKQRHIFCIDSARINICGKLKMFVFDKTGTLTEDTLAISGIIPAHDGVLHPLVESTDNVDSIPMVKGMASCHTLSMVSGEVKGDPLDSYMFAFTNWAFLKSVPIDALHTVVPPSGLEKNGLKVIKQFPFQSSLQRMSVITKDSDSKLVAFSKGSPEMILSMCTDPSKPKDILKVLEQNAKNGYRVLAIATKTFSTDTSLESLSKMSRSDVECELDFLGLIVFENSLKPISSEIIDSLWTSNIRVCMATGDNLFTAVTVAHEVGIIKPYQRTICISFQGDDLKYESLQDGQNKFLRDKDHANPWSPLSLDYTITLTGETYMTLRDKYPDVCKSVLVAGSVFARMSPDQKTVLVEDLKLLGYGVGMCGDGANDCGALKAAHAGIALSTSEASVAAPFTSKVFNISCVPTLIREGRSSLVTAFSVFRYLTLYCFVQFFGVLILFSIRSGYSDNQYLYMDLFLCIPFTGFLVLAEANDILICKRPPGHLFHPIFLGTILLHILILFIFQLIVFFIVRHMPWYSCPKIPHDRSFNYVSFENYSVLMLSVYQDIWLSMVCYPGRPYNKPMYRNIKYMALLIVLTLLTLFIQFTPSTTFSDLLNLQVIPSIAFKAMLLFFSVLYLFISYLVEEYLQHSHFFHRLSRKIMRKTEPRNQYKHVLDKLHVDTAWPPVS